MHSSLYWVCTACRVFCVLFALIPVGHIIYVGKAVILNPCQRETHIQCDDGQVTVQVPMECKVSKFGGLGRSYCMGICL